MWLDALKLCLQTLHANETGQAGREEGSSTVSRRGERARAFKRARRGDAGEGTPRQQRRSADERTVHEAVGKRYVEMRATLSHHTRAGPIRPTPAARPGPAGEDDVTGHIMVRWRGNPLAPDYEMTSQVT